MLPPPDLVPALADVTAAIATATPTSLSMGSFIPTLTAVASAVATSFSYVDAQHKSHHDEPPPEQTGECSLLGPFAILVQGALGCLALLALVFKRWRERPQRPLKVWSFDVSKQVVGSILVHLANILMSMLSSGQFNLKVEPATVLVQRGMVAKRMLDADGNFSPNPCSFYLLNLAIDTTVGIPILIFLLRIFTALFALTPIGQPRESIESGNYGSPPKSSWWLKQSLIYFLGLMGMKLCVLIIFLVLPWISVVGDWALRWTEGSEVLQVMFVMLVFPLIMNATQYYIIDTFIKKQKPGDHELIPDHDDDSEAGHVERYEDPDSGSSDEIHSGDEEDPELSAKVNEVKRKSKISTRAERGSGGSARGKRTEGLKSGRADYDPVTDGESSPTVVGSAGTSERRRKEMGSGEETGK